MRNLPLSFDYSTYSQKLGEDFAKFCGLLRIYDLYDLKKYLEDYKTIICNSTYLGYLLGKAHS